MLEDLKIYSQNVHKNHAWTQHLLDSLKDEYHVILIQEPPFLHIKNIPSGLNKDGEPECDTTHHPSWTKIYKKSNVSAYISLSALKTTNLFLAPPIDDNIIHFSLVRSDTQERTNIINCYNDPEKDTLTNLVSFLDAHPLTRTVIMGDFNIHSPIWDEKVQYTPPRTEKFYLSCTNAGFSLMNDPAVPTWTQGESSSVIDLAFIQLDLGTTHLPCLTVDLANRTADH